MSKKHRTQHHTIPSSRCIVRLPMRIHNAWHYLFQNLLPQEAKSVVEKKWPDKNGKAKDELFKDARFAKEFEKVFGSERDIEKICDIIDTNFRHRGIVAFSIPEETRRKHFRIKITEVNKRTYTVKLEPMK